jgi:hypothetical protein
LGRKLLTICPPIGNEGIVEGVFCWVRCIHGRVSKRNN